MVARRSICVPHVRQHDHRTAGSPGGICFSTKDARFPTAQLISLAGAEDDGGRHRFAFITGHYFAMASTGSSSS